MPVSGFQVYWIKDGERINPDVDRNFVFMRNGQLALRRVRVEDEGIYICVAENSVGMRQTDPARLDILGKFTALNVAIVLGKL